LKKKTTKSLYYYYAFGRPKIFFFGILRSNNIIINNNIPLITTSLTTSSRLPTGTMMIVIIIIISFITAVTRARMAGKHSTRRHRRRHVWKSETPFFLDSSKTLSTTTRWSAHTDYFLDKQYTLFSSLLCYYPMAFSWSLWVIRQTHECCGYSKINLQSAHDASAVPDCLLTRFVREEFREM